MSADPPTPPPTPSTTIDLFATPPINWHTFTSCATPSFPHPPSEAFPHPPPDAPSSRTLCVKNPRSPLVSDEKEGDPETFSLTLTLTTGDGSAPPCGEELSLRFVSSLPARFAPFSLTEDADACGTFTASFFTPPIKAVFALEAEWVGSPTFAHANWPLHFPLGALHISHPGSYTPASLDPCLGSPAPSERGGWWLPPRVMLRNDFLEDTTLLWVSPGCSRDLYMDARTLAKHLPQPVPFPVHVTGSGNDVANMLDSHSPKADAPRDLAKIMDVVTESPGLFKWRKLLPTRNVAGYTYRHPGRSPTARTESLSHLATALLDQKPKVAIVALDAKDLVDAHSNDPTLPQVSAFLDQIKDWEGSLIWVLSPRVWLKAHPDIPSPDQCVCITPDSASCACVDPTDVSRAFHLLPQQDLESDDTLRAVADPSGRQVGRWSWHNTVHSPIPLSDANQKSWVSPSAVQAANEAVVSALAASRPHPASRLVDYFSMTTSAPPAASFNGTHYCPTDLESLRIAHSMYSPTCYVAAQATNMLATFFTVFKK